MRIAIPCAAAAALMLSGCGNSTGLFGDPNGLHHGGNPATLELTTFDATRADVLLQANGAPDGGDLLIVDAADLSHPVGVELQNLFAVSSLSVPGSVTFSDASGLGTAYGVQDDGSGNPLDATYAPVSLTVTITGDSLAVGASVTVDLSAETWSRTDGDPSLPDTIQIDSAHFVTTVEDACAGGC